MNDGIRNIVFYVNSSYGVGHYVRISRIAEKLASKAGVSVILITAGVPFPQNIIPTKVKCVELPSLTFLGDKVASTFNRDSSTKKQIYQQRAELLRDVLKSTHVDLFLVEYFPFSKYGLYDEVVLIIDCIRCINHRATVVVSLREIIHSDAISNASRITAFINKHCNALLVHGDPHFITFGSCYPAYTDLKIPIIYTGFVTRIHKKQRVVQSGPVIFSMGGGRDGQGIVNALKEIAIHSNRPDLIVFPGPLLPAEEMHRLDLISKEFERIHIRNFQEYSVWIPRASAVVCQAGYNTIWESVSNGIPAFVLPRNRPEQRIRAEHLDSLGVLKSFNSPRELGEAFYRRECPKHLTTDFNFCGDERAARIVLELCQR